MDRVTKLVKLGIPKKLTAENCLIVPTRNDAGFHFTTEYKLLLATIKLIELSWHSNHFWA